jgi:hypothetical protein
MPIVWTGRVRLNSSMRWFEWRSCNLAARTYWIEILCLWTGKFEAISRVESGSSLRCSSIQPQLSSNSQITFKMSSASIKWRGQLLQFYCSHRF